MVTLIEGKKAPAFTGIDQNGKKISLADYKGKKSGSLFLSAGYDTYLYGAGLQSSGQLCHLKEKWI